MESGIMAAIAQLGVVNAGKDDRETQKLIKQIIEAMTEKKRNLWPDKKLRTIVNEMDDIQKQYFLVTMMDMDAALTEAYGIVENQGV